MLGGGTSSGWPLFQTAVVLLCALLHVAERAVRLRAPALRERARASTGGRLLEAALLGAAVGAVIATAGAGGEFIYFQF